MLPLFSSTTLKPLYCFCTWTLAGLFLWSIWQAGKDGVAQLRRLHQIPCGRCVFFTKDYRLKCTVHPTKSLTEEAINCSDYEPITSPSTTVYSKSCQQFGWSKPKSHAVCHCRVKRSCLRVNSQ